jgi:3-oxoacyl-[acyl-carrier-protein] synthase-3
MIGIKGIASFVPDTVVDNLAQAQRFGEDQAFIDEKIGARFLPRRGEGMETSDMAQAAVEALFARHPDLQRDMVDALVVVTQNGDGEGLPHTAAVVQHKLELCKSVAAFDISLGCSGYVYGLYVLKGLMAATGLRNAVLVTADPYSKIVDTDDRVTTLLFGDAATATWLGEGAQWMLGDVLFGTDGSGANHLQKVGGRLSMNGRQVFNFASLQVAPHIRQLLNQAGLAERDVDAYCLHQGSMAILNAVSRRFPDVEERFVKDMGRVGNTVSSSIPLVLEKNLFLESWNRVVISGFGVGLSWASALLTRNGGAK